MLSLNLHTSSFSSSSYQADDLLQEVKDLELKTNQIIDSALPKKEGMEQKPYLALKAIDTRHKQIELKGKILGAFKKDDSPKETGIVIVKTLKGVSMDDL